MDACMHARTYVHSRRYSRKHGTKGLGIWSLGSEHRSIHLLKKIWWYFCAMLSIQRLKKCKQKKLKCLHCMQNHYFKNVENNYFCMKCSSFKPWNVLILMQNCRDVRFSKHIWTLMLPLIHEYDNAPRLLWPSIFRSKTLFFKAYFASACLKITDFSYKI